MTKIILETERLKVREFNENDSAFIVELLNSEGWLKYIGDKNIKTTENALKYLETVHFMRYKRDGFGFYMVEIKENQVAIGMCGLIKRDGFEDADIGFAFLPAYNKQGYAFESAKAILTYGFEQLKMKKIAAYTMPINSNSIHLIEKLGMKYEKNVRFQGEETDLLMYAI